MLALRNLRIKHGFTQAALGNLIGVSSGCICQYETGVRSPNIRTLKRLAEVLHCTTDDILKENDETQENE